MCGGIWWVWGDALPLSFRGILNWLGCFDVVVMRRGGWWERLAKAPHDSSPFYFWPTRDLSWREWKGKKPDETKEKGRRSGADVMFGSSDSGDIVDLLSLSSVCFFCYQSFKSSQLFHTSFKHSFTNKPFTNNVKTSLSSVFLSVWSHSGQSCFFTGALTSKRVDCVSWPQSEPAGVLPLEVKHLLWYRASHEGLHIFTW